MNQHNPSHELMEKVALAASAPDPTEEFFNHLRRRLENRAGARRTAERRFRRIAWSLSLAAFLVLGACVLIVGPANVVNGVREALGYIPGFGVVRTTGLRVLAEPVSVTRDGITLKIKSVIADSAQTVVSYEVTGMNLPPMVPMSTPDPGACVAPPFLRFSGNQELHSIGGGGMQTETYIDASDQYPPLPDDVVDVTLVYACLPGTLPGSAPENWEVPLHLVSNPVAPSVVPLQRIDTPSMDNGTPSPQGVQNLFQQQIKLSIESMAEVEDGFIIMGTVQTTSDLYLIDPFFPPGAIEIRDSTGAEIPIEVASVGNDDPAMPENQVMPAKWAYKVQGKYFHGPLTLLLKWITISPKDPIIFNMDVGTNPQDGQSWILDKRLNLFGCLAEVQSAKYVVREDMGPETMRGLEFSVRLPDEIEGLQLNYWDPNPQPGSVDASSGLSDGLRHGKDTVRVGFLSTAPLSGTVGVTANVIFLKGPWTTAWNPPPVAGAPSPTPVPQACLTNDSWEAIRTGPVPPLPPAVGGRMFYSRQIPPDIFSDLLLSGLDGSDERLLKAGVMDGDLSEDETRLAVIDGSGSLVVMNVGANDTIGLAGDAGIAHPVWSPDGQWIAFVVMDPGGGLAKLYIIHPDGTGRREVGENANGRDLAGWFPDSSSLLILASDDDQVAGLVMKKLDLATDGASPVLPDILVGGAALSSDGEWIAYQKQEFGRSAPWISIARLDGSARRLVAKLEGRWASYNPVWSPDGKWLSISVLDTQDWSQAFGVNIIINPATCEVIPLPGVDGVIKSWIT
ncbi:MAG: hypothetical protein WBM17_02545 [Anaerolineales bacterium]